MPVPEHLKNIAYDLTEKTVSDELQFCNFKIKCTCGCEFFNISQNYLTKKENELLRPYYDALEKSTKSVFGSGCTKDENGNFHYWIYKTSKGCFGRKEEVFIPPKPYFSGITVIKAVCAECESEYILYDSRKHGYDSFCMEASPEEMNYSPHFRKKNKSKDTSKKILTELEYSGDKNDFFDSFPDGDYNNSFSWIQIYSVDRNGKKRKIFDIETA